MLLGRTNSGRQASRVSNQCRRYSQLGILRNLVHVPLPQYKLTELLSYSLGDRHGGDTPGLRAPDDAAAREAHLGHVLRHLRRLPGPGLSDHHQNSVPSLTFFAYQGGEGKKNKRKVRSTISGFICMYIDLVAKRRRLGITKTVAVSCRGNWSLRYLTAYIAPSCTWITVHNRQGGVN